MKNRAAAKGWKMIKPSLYGTEVRFINQKTGEAYIIQKPFALTSRERGYPWVIYHVDKRGKWRIAQMKGRPLINIRTKEEALKIVKRLIRVKTYKKHSRRW